MWFGLLGPLQVLDGCQAVPVPRARERMLLAALLLRAGRAVPSEQLAEIVWDGAPTERSAVTLRSHVMRLRRSLGPAAAERITTTSYGYLITVAEDEFDVLSYTALYRRAEAAARSGEWQQAHDALTKAASLWRGAPLADIPAYHLRATEGSHLEELHLQATRLRLEADLELGRPGQVLPELRSLVARYPLEEPLHALLILALYRTGRRADALDAYRTAACALADQLGIDPGPELTDLHKRILAGDAGLARGTRPTDRLVPRQLPPPVSGFAGRVPERAALSRLLAGRDADSGPRALVISAIAGTAGVGKTALAVQWAHEVLDLFPDGQLYVNLRGYDPGPPLSPAEALSGFLRALGVAGPDIPAGTHERAAAYRSLLAGRRVLVLLDNARSAEQVRPLLGGARGSLVLVTSRDALGGLVARDGAKRLDLDLLPLADAVDLLRTLIGPRADADAGAVRALALRCARLPLALRIAAELVASRPRAAIADLAGDLASRQQLDVLDASGDSQTAVRAVFSWSYRELGAGAARAFALLGLHQGTDFETHAAAAVLGLPVPHARTMLDRLGRAHLLQSAGAERHSMHDLLRTYAAEVAACDLTEPDRREAITRFLDYYLHAAALAMDMLFPGEQSVRPDVPRAQAGRTPLAGAAGARAWLDAQRANLIAASAVAVDGWPGYAGQLAATVFRYLDDGGHARDVIALYELAREDARVRHDRIAETAALTSLATAQWRLSEYDAAAVTLRDALEVCRAVADKPGEARALGTLGLVVAQQGHYELAAGYYRQAQALYCGLGLVTGEMSCVGNLGDIDYKLGRYESAAVHHRRALELARQAGNRTLEAVALISLGVVTARQDRGGEAAGYLRDGLDLARETGNRACEAEALQGLGELSLQGGEHAAAARLLEQALDLFRATGDRSGEAQAQAGLGDVLLATGHASPALARYGHALTVATQIGAAREKARALDGLGRAHAASGETASARERWEEALRLFTDLGAPEAAQIRELLG